MAAPLRLSRFSSFRDYLKVSLPAGGHIPPYPPLKTWLHPPTKSKPKMQNQNQNQNRNQNQSPKPRFSIRVVNFLTPTFGKLYHAQGHLMLFFLKPDRIYISIFLLRRHGKYHLKILLWTRIDSAHL
jgi:hypothetical protein